MAERLNEGIFRVIRFVASPLRFFAVAISVLLASIFGLAWKSTLPPETTALLIYILLFVVGFLILLVSFLIIWHPRKLVFDQEAHLTYLRERLGDNMLETPYIPGTIQGEEPPVQIEGRSK